MSIVMEILEDLWNTKLRYKGVLVNIFGVTRFWENKKGYSKSSFDITLARLIKKGFVETKSGKWFLTKAGKEYFEDKRKLYLKFGTHLKDMGLYNCIKTFKLAKPYQIKINTNKRPTNLTAV